MQVPRTPTTTGGLERPGAHRGRWRTRAVEPAVHGGDRADDGRSARGQRRVERVCDRRRDRRRGVPPRRDRPRPPAAHGAETTGPRLAASRRRRVGEAAERGHDGADDRRSGPSDSARRVARRPSAGRTRPGRLRARAFGASGDRLTWAIRGPGFGAGAARADATLRLRRCSRPAAPQARDRRPWGCSSAGRAPRSHRGGQGFESPHLHHSLTFETRLPGCPCQDSPRRARRTWSAWSSEWPA